MRKVELLSPAGDLDKLRVAYDYGADAAYMGIYPFSLRKKAHEVRDYEYSQLNDIRKSFPSKKLFGAANIIFSPNDIDELSNNIDAIEKMNLDGIIVSDMGAASVLKNRLESVPLHLSTQSSCINHEAVKFYKSFGFKRIILGRECTLDDIKRIKDSNPDVEIEVFVHGAMCMAVSGRCILSKAMSNRSANKGECSHSCRWKYRLAIEEEERKGEYMPIYEDDGFTTILSSRDLCMINNLDDVINAGVDSLKIEGRMKSVYYVASVTRAYRKALDRAQDANIYIDELINVSHREYTTGFFYSEEKNNFRPPKEEYTRNYRFLGIINEEVKKDIYSVDIRYKISPKNEIEYIGPDVFLIKDNNFKTLDENFEEVDSIDHGKVGYIQTKAKLKKGYIVRQEI